MSGALLDNQLATAKLSSRPDSSTEGNRMILVGNPNVGKSVLFGNFTGRYVTVSNYPGTTVEITAGKGTLNDEPYELIDTPGTNGLIPQSEDERVTRDIILDLPGSTLLQVGDLKNLRRTLLLSVQIAEYGLPFTLCLNMADEASDLGITVDTERLGSVLGVSVVATSAIRPFEHMLSERVVDRVCTFLGHPPKCPHGRSIPPGSCCNRFDRSVEPLVSRLCDLPISGYGTIVFMAPTSSWLNRLSGLGVVPGTEVRLMQRKPSIVISCGQTSIAIEDEIARGIYVRTDPSRS